MPRTLLATVFALVAVSPASALVLLHDHEQHGNEPYQSNVGMWKQVAAVLNSPGREYWRDRGSSGFGSDHHEIVAAFAGDAAQLNQLLRILAELPDGAKAEVVLAPGAAFVTDKNGRRIRCDWRARLTYQQVSFMQNRPANQPPETLKVRLEVYLPDSPKPAPPASAKQVSDWIDDLDARQFAVRELAQRQLIRQGARVREPLLEAITTTSSAERKRRLEQILKQFSQLQLADIVKPNRLPMLSFDQLVEREGKSLPSKEHATRWSASQRVHDVVEGSALLPLLTALLDDQALAALKRQTEAAPKDYLQAFKPLLSKKPPAAGTRREHVAQYRDLRQRLDRFCK